MITEIGTHVSVAKDYLLKDKLVAIPTETVYGLAGSIFSPRAIEEIYRVKNRPRFNPLIVHTHDRESIQILAVIGELESKLIEKFMPGPFTLLLPKKEIVPDIVTAGSSKVAIRIPRHPMTLDLLSSLPFPLAAPSANPSGYVSPTKANHVFEGLRGEIPYILDGGDCIVGIESTIAEVIDDKVLIHRYGSITEEDIYAITGKLPEIISSSGHVHAPGQMKSHYATNTPLYKGTIPLNLKRFEGKRVALITLRSYYLDVPLENHFLLSKDGFLGEAAKNLFKVMRMIDEAGYDAILAEDFPNEGIGKAINDKLNRAMHDFKN